MAQISSPALAGWLLSPDSEVDEPVFYPSPPRLNSPERSQSPPPTERQRAAPQPLALPNNTTGHGWKLMPQSLPAPPSAPPMSSMPKRRHLNSVEQGSKLPGANKKTLPKPPFKNRFSLPEGWSWPKEWTPSQETLTYLRGLVPPQAIPIVGALPGLWGGARVAQRMWQFRGQLESRALWSQRQLRNLSMPTSVSHTQAVHDELERHRISHRIELAALRAVQRTSTFHLTNQAVELACIIVATAPAVAGLLRWTPKAGLVQSLSRGMPLLLGVNGVMSLIRYGGELSQLDAVGFEKPIALPQTNWLSWSLGLQHLNTASLAPGLHPEKIRTLGPQEMAKSGSMELAAEQSYLRRQIAAWSSFTAGVICVSGWLVQGAVAGAIGAVLLGAGIVMSQLQHVLHGRRFDIPEVLWQDAQEPDIAAPPGLFGAMAFDDLNRAEVAAHLAREQTHLRKLRDAIRPLCRPRLRRIVSLLPHLLRIEAVSAPVALGLRWGLTPHLERAAASLATATFEVWEGRRALYAHMANERLERFETLTKSSKQKRQDDPHADVSHAQGPIDEIQAASLLEAEHMMFVEEAQRLQEQIAELEEAMRNQGDVWSVMAPDVKASGHSLIGPLIWQLHSQHEAWSKTVLWCTKMACYNAARALNETKKTPLSTFKFGK